MLRFAPSFNNISISGAFIAFLNNAPTRKNCSILFRLCLYVLFRLLVRVQFSRCSLLYRTLFLVQGEDELLLLVRSLTQREKECRYYIPCHRNEMAFDLDTSIWTVYTIPVDKIIENTRRFFVNRISSTKGVNGCSFFLIDEI